MKQKIYLIVGILGAAIALVAVMIFADAKPEYAHEAKPVLPYGNAASSIKLVEYGDYECPACATAHPFVKQILMEYGPDISFEYKQFPLPQHRFAQIAAEGALCANDQDAFWQAHDYLYGNQSSLSKEFVRGMAGTLGLNVDWYQNCLDSAAKRDAVAADKASGTALQIPGTPSFFLDGERVVDVTRLSALVKEKVDAAKAAVAALEAESAAAAKKKK